MIALQKCLRGLALTLPVCMAVATLPGLAHAQETIAKETTTEEANTQATTPVIKASEPKTVVAALQDLGYRAELTRDKEGDPMISSAAAGFKFSIFFYNCDDNTDCRTLRLHCGFHIDGGIKLEQANDWNKGHLFSKVYLDDQNDPRFVTDIRIGEGIPKSVFDTHMQIYDTDLATFAKQIGFK